MAGDQDTELMMENAGLGIGEQVLVPLYGRPNCKEVTAPLWVSAM